MTDSDKILQALARLEAGQKALQTDVQGLKSDVQGLQTDVKDLKSDVKTLQDGQKLLQADVNTLQDGQKSLQANVKLLQDGQKSLEQGQTTTNLKVEAFHAEQNEANKEIITTIHDVITIDAKETAKRFERIEKHLNLPPLK